MNSDHPTIYEFDFSLICEYFSSVKRQGPGSPEATLRALSFIETPGVGSRIADLGCGTGGQTMVLAQHVQSHITGVDLFPAFIDLFNANVVALGLQNRVAGVVGSMDHLSFQPGELDVVWSEGAIYNVGFERGVNEWRSFLKTGGYIAVTEATWLTDERPAEINDFWVNAYPEIDTMYRKTEQLQKAGYLPVATFVLPETCWTDHFFAPQVAAQDAFLKKYAGNATVESLIAMMRREADLYRRYKEYYGYVFYIGKKI